MTDQLTTRWIRLQRESTETAQQFLTETITPFAEANQKINRAELPPTPREVNLATMVHSLWKAFFAQFRDDEREFEFPHYQAAGLLIEGRLQQLQANDVIDANTVQLMLDMLLRFQKERFRDTNERIDDLMASCQQLRAQLEVSELSKCYQEDELNACQRIIRKELQRLGVAISEDDVVTPSQELRILLQAVGRNASSRITQAVAPMPEAVPDKEVDEALDIHARDSLDWTKLHSAAFVGKIELVKLLLAKGAAVNAKAKDGTTPLHLAAKRGHVAVAKLLFAQGANLTAKDNDGNTPLHVAAELYTVDMINELIHMGAMVNNRNESGWTPLHLATNKGKQEVVGVFLRSGADVNAVASNGWTPTAVAVNCGHLQLTKFLQEHGGRA
jgi:Ankyrin repeats (3 copies)/Ankyrin repeat